MYFEQITTPGLGCFSYILGCPRAGVAAVVDPRRDIGVYLEAVKAHGMRVTHIFETHVHADHVSGARELARATGAKIYIHESAPVAYATEKVQHNDSFSIGNADIRVLHTPGHTPNSISLLVTDKSRSDEPEMILTGDLLFVGDTGRPDLPGHEILNEQIENLYASLHEVLGGLPDFLEVYPAHGQGSLCGKGMSAKPSSTLGYERIANSRMLLKDFAEFKTNVLTDLPMRPQSFSHIIATNIKGAPLLDKETADGRALSPAEVEKLQAEGALVLDLRNSLSFSAAHVPGSINVDAAPPPAINWIGAAVPPGSPLILVLAHESDFTARLTELRRIGYDDVRGYLAGGIKAWIAAGKNIGSLTQISPRELEENPEAYAATLLLDVRTAQEYENFHLPGAIHLPLDKLVNDKACPLDPNIPRITICQSGYRAAIAASLLLSRGYKKVGVLAGGMGAVGKHSA